MPSVQDILAQAGVFAVQGAQHLDLNEVARAMISKVDVDTAYGPSISIDDPFEPGPPNPYLQRLKPRVVLHLRGGEAQPVVIAPYGEPGPTQWPLIRSALIVSGFAVGGLALWKLLR